MSSFTPVQAQSFFVYGNGCVIGDTTLILSSFKGIDGNNLTMANFGTVGTFTIEPNAGTQEEQGIFTGVTQNSNGTATLTGISSVAFISPYTQTVGFVKSHFGNTTVVLSDTAFLYSQYANLNSDETFMGNVTFAQLPIIPTGTSSQTTNGASIGYVNSVAIAGAPVASNTVIGITQLSVAPVNASTPIAVGQNDPILPSASESLALVGDGGTPSNTNTYVTQIGYQNGSESFAVTTGGSVAYNITLKPTPLGYVKGERIYFQANVASGTSPTLNKNGLGAIPLIKMVSTGSTSLAIGDMGTGSLNVVEYNGGQYQMISPLSNYPPETYTTGNGSFSAIGSQTITVGFLPKLIKISAVCVPSPNAVASSIGAASSVANQACAYQASVSGQSIANLNSVILYMPNTAGTAEAQSTIFSISGTGFILSNTVANVTAYYIYEAYA